MIILKDTVYTGKDRSPALPIYSKKATGAQMKMLIPISELMP